MTQERYDFTWVCLTFYPFGNRYSGLQNYVNHSFGYVAAFTEMEALYSLQFYKLKHNHMLKYNLNLKLPSLDM